jgi:hypothetical protein
MTKGALAMAHPENKEVGRHGKLSSVPAKPEAKIV